MTQYISKSALVAEIEKRIKEREEEEKKGWAYSRVKIVECEHILSFIDTLEVKEIDLEKEIENLLEKEKAFVTDNREVKYYNGDSFNHIYELEFIAKHFFELGMSASNKARKGDNI